MVCTRPICSVLGRATIRQPQHSQDCTICFIQLNYVHKSKQNKIRCYHLMLNFPAKRWHMGFYFLFLSSAILHSCIFGNRCLYLLKFPFNTCHPSIIFVGFTKFLSIGMHLRILWIFLSSISVLGVMNMFHGQHVSHKWHVFLNFVMSCPEPPMGRSEVGSFPVWSGGSLIIFLAF